MGLILTCDLHSARGLARVARWSDLWGPRVDLTFRAAPPDERDELRLDLPDGQTLWNARALAHLRRGAVWAWAVRHAWIAAELAELVWRLGAVLAPVLAVLSPLTRGPSLVTPRLSRTRALALQVIGLATLAAALSWWAQVDGLVGDHGILPAADWLDAVRRHTAPGAPGAGQSAFWLAPTWLWLDASNAALALTCGLTALGALGLVFGILPGPAAILSFAGYLSITVTGGVFTGYQWDQLLLESLVMAAILAPWATLGYRGARPPPPSAVALSRVLAFKLYFLSGVVKIASGDPVWADGTALDYHLWTQPLPSPTSFILLDAPPWLLSALTEFTLFAELVLPWALLLPAGLRRTRNAATLAMLALQFGIFATGNFGFFNILTVGLLVMGLDDGVLSSGRRWRPARVRARSDAMPVWFLPASMLRAVVAVGLVVLALFEVRSVWLKDELPQVVKDLRAELSPLHVSNTYGLFANMTTERPEIEVRGSDDGRTWLTYDFAWKPDAETDAPRFAGPHMPRLDWQLWFAALAGNCQNAPWYPRFVTRLLQGSPDVLALIGKNPFPNHPPRYIRSLLWDFTPSPEGGWRRSESRPFCPDLELRAGQLRRARVGG